MILQNIQLGTKHIFIYLELGAHNEGVYVPRLPSQSYTLRCNSLQSWKMVLQNIQLGTKHIFISISYY